MYDGGQVAFSNMFGLMPITWRESQQEVSLCGVVDTQEIWLSILLQNLENELDDYWRVGVVTY